MRRNIFFVFALLFVVACGNGIHIEKHYRTQKQIEKMSGVPMSLGWAEWNEDLGECDIYIVRKETVPEETYFEVLGLETEHCFEGHYHK